MNHVYQGLCPDESQPDASDPACPACLEMQAGKAALAENKALRDLLEEYVDKHTCERVISTNQESCGKCFLCRAESLVADPALMAALSESQRAVAFNAPERKVKSECP